MKWKPPFRGHSGTLAQAMVINLCDVTVRSVTPILNVSSIDDSLAWFARLGWETTFVWTEPDGGDEAGFAGVGLADVEIFLCRGGQGAQGTQRSAFPFDESTGGVWMSWFLDNVDEVDQMHERAISLGLDVAMEPTDEPWVFASFTSAIPTATPSASALTEPRPAVAAD